MQEPILDVNELKTLGLLDGLKEGDKIDVLLERLEHPKNGEIIVAQNGSEQKFEVKGGLVEVLKNKIVILV